MPISPKPPGYLAAPIKDGREQIPMGQRQMLHDRFNQWQGDMMNPPDRTFGAQMVAAGGVLASMGRRGDTEVGHLTNGEMVVPREAQTPSVIRAIKQGMNEAGLDFGQYVVGHRNSMNPSTGLPEFGGYEGGGTDMGGGDYGGGGAGDFGSPAEREASVEGENMEGGSGQRESVTPEGKSYSRGGNAFTDAIDRALGLGTYAGTVDLGPESKGQQAFTDPDNPFSFSFLDALSPMSTGLRGIAMGIGQALSSMGIKGDAPEVAAASVGMDRDTGGGGVDYAAPRAQMTASQIAFLQNAASQGFSFGNVPLPNLATGQSLTGAQQQALAQGTMYLGDIGQSRTPSGVTFVAPVKNRFRDEWNWASIADSYGASPAYGRGNGWGSNIT